MGRTQAGCKAHHRGQGGAGRLSQQQGFTLVEILVAVLVLSFGILGTAGMQAASLRANREARTQEAGTRMATELAELMRANHIVARKKMVADNPYLLDFVKSAPAASIACFTAESCATDLDAARRDVADWSQRAAKALPGIQVKVCFDASPYGANGLPEWTCDGKGDTLYVKIGWLRTDVDGRKTTLNAASAPAVVIPVSPPAT